MVSLARHILSPTAPIEQLTEQSIGGKAANLLRLVRFEFPVPAWCVIATEAFDDALRDNKRSIEKILAAIDSAAQDSFDLAAQRIRDIILALEVADGRELETALQQIIGRNSLFSVRSSVVGEDSVRNSFAGQMDSFLNVPLAEVPSAIIKVWASAFSSRTLVYRKRKKLSLIDVSAAVIVQKMVESTRSGVLFTRDSADRTARCVISAGLGLGEGVVDNVVETDTYWIHQNSDEIHRDVAKKEHRLVYNSVGRAGNRKEAVPAWMKMRPVLTDRQIKRLRDVGKKAECDFGAPQDIEWAFDEQGELFILQTRPIVCSKNQPALASVRIWDNANVVESYPGLTLPLTFSFARAAYESTFRKAALSFLLFKNEVRNRPRFFKNMIGLLDGRIYYNLLNWYEMLSYLPGFGLHKKSWDQMIGISERIEFPQNKLPPINWLYSLLATAWKLFADRSSAKRFFAHFNSAYQHFKDADFSTATEQELIAAYESLTHGLADKWHLTLDNDLRAMLYYDTLKRFSRRWGPSDHPNLHNDLLCGETDVESVAPIRSLARLAESFRANPCYRPLLDCGSDLAVWQKIQGESIYAPLKESLEAYLKAFGDRTVEDLKLETRGLREEPERLIRMIKNQSQLGGSIAAAEIKEQEIRRTAEGVVGRHLRNPFKRCLFECVLVRTRRAVVNRENMRFARSRLFGVVRKIFRRMAELFVEKGVLESASDIDYLTVDEVFSFVEGTAVTENLRALVQVRKNEYAEFGKKTTGERLRTVGSPYLNALTPRERSSSFTKCLTGIGCASGIAAGTAKIIFEPRGDIVGRDSILVAHSTDPGWVFLMIQSKGIVVEKGSVLSHSAIIGRELGIPTIIGVKDATKRIPDDHPLFINGTTGEVRWR